MGEAERDPKWIRAAAGAVVHEWREYARTAWATTVAPARSLRAWAAGESSALNPFACIANALALITVSELFWRFALHRSDDLPPWFDLIKPALSVFNSAVTVSLFHLPLIALGGRARWRTSFAAALFVTSGPLLPLYLLRGAIVPIQLSLTRDLTAPQLAYVGAILATLLAYLVAALGGAHEVARWRVIVAIVIGSAALALLALLVSLAGHAR